MSVVVSIRTARKLRLCSTRAHYVGCWGAIEVGQQYRRAVQFPDYTNGARDVLVLDECQKCAEYHGRWNTTDLYDQFEEALTHG